VTDLVISAPTLKREITQSPSNLLKFINKFMDKSRTIFLFYAKNSFQAKFDASDALLADTMLTKLYATGP
jgi:hypothetical protein